MVIFKKIYSVKRIDLVNIPSLQFIVKKGEFKDLNVLMIDDLIIKNMELEGCSSLIRIE